MVACHARASYTPRTTHACDAARLVREHLPEFIERIEWTVPSPAPHHTFDEPPVIK
jgi:hypothetical protein